MSSPPQLKGVAKFTNGQIAENDIGLRIKVKDQNDNLPVFDRMNPGAVDELSAEGMWPAVVPAEKKCDFIHTINITVIMIRV